MEDPEVREENARKHLEMVRSSFSFVQTLLSKQQEN